MKKLGRPTQEPLGATIQIRVPLEVKQAIQKHVDAIYEKTSMRVTVSNYVLSILEQWIKEKK